MAKHLPPDDDGRTIVSMDVEGMPGHRPAPDAPEKSAEHPHPSPPSRAEMRWFMWGAVRAGLVVACVIIAGIVLFVFLTTR